MNKGIMAIGVSLLAGFAAAAIMLTARAPERPAASGADPGDYFDQSAAIADRIRALEAAVAEERDARQLLEDELQNVYAEIERLSNERDEEDEQRAMLARESREQTQASRRQRVEQANETRVASLVEAGLSPDRAEWILRRESELQMQAIQARFDARRSGEPFDPFSATLSPGAALRAEIGDAQYEQYLQGSNRPTAVSVGGVLESSPGQRAGLQAGDQIVRYDGNRVFDIGDLNRQTMVGEPGESVMVDIIRDGIPMQVVLPRGPIGVSSGRFRGGG